MKRKLKGFFILIILIIFIYLIFFFNFSFAQSRNLELEYPNIPGAPRPTTVSTPLPDYVKYIFNFGIAIFGLIVLGVLIQGGVKYFLAAGKPAALSEARNQIFAAFLGLLFILSSYLILTTINPQLVVFNLPNLPSLKSFRCTNDDDCRRNFQVCEDPDACYCDVQSGLCRGKLQAKETTLIAYEIPLGEFVKKGVWGENNISQLLNNLSELEDLLNSEIKINPTFNSISDLSKYLVTLTNDCNCDVLKGVCTTPETGGGAVGCFGDPCQDVRDKITKVQDKIGQIMKQLGESKNKIEKRLQFSVGEDEKFNKAYDELLSCFEKGNLLKLTDFLETAQFFHEKGFKLNIIKNPFFPTSGVDELTFYCVMGGTIFDRPREPLGSESISLQNEKEVEDFLEITGNNPLFCPLPIPLPDLFENLSFETLKLNHGLSGLIKGLDSLSEALQELLESVSKCSREDACTITCAQGPNPCYRGRGACFPIPYTHNKFCCNPLSLPPCLFCVPGVTDGSPNLQVRGGGASCKGNPDPPYNGSPCPKDDLDIILNKISYLEERIQEEISESKHNLSAKTSFVIDTPQGEINLLEGIISALSVCKGSYPKKKDIFVANCLEAIGSKGPNDTVIASCDPGLFFCCATDEATASSLTLNFKKATNYKEERNLLNYDFSLVKPSPVETPLRGECSVNYIFTETAQCYTNEEKNNYRRNVEGIAQTWVKLPEDLGYYNFYSGLNDKWGKPEFISLIVAISQRFYKNFHKKLWIGDITGKCAPAVLGVGGRVTHITHDIGTDVDIDVKGLSFEQKRELAKMFIDCGIDRILYSGPGWEELQKEFGRNKIYNVSGHEKHFHVRFEKRPGHYTPQFPPITRIKFGPHRTYKGIKYR
jgi:hypothetical protein